MKKIFQKGLSFQFCVLLLIAWCAVILLLGHVFRLGISGVFCFLYVPACILLVYYQLKDYKPVKNDVGTVGIFLYYSWVLLLLAYVINAVYIFVGNKKLSAFVITADIILLIVYIAIILLGTTYQNRLSNRVQKVQKSTAFSSKVSHEIGVMLSGASDPIIHKELADLKTLIDYSTSADTSGIDEAAFYSEFEKLSTMISTQSDMTEIIKEISKVEALWKARNARL